MTKSRAWSVTFLPQPMPLSPAESTEPLHLAVASADKSVHILSISSSGIHSAANSECRLRALLDSVHKRAVRWVAVQPGSPFLMASASFDASVAIWKASDVVGDSTIESMGDTMDSTVDSTADSTAEPKQCARNKGYECIATLEGHENEVKCVAWSPVSPLLATCGRDKSIWIWEGECLCSSSFSL